MSKLKLCQALCTSFLVLCFSSVAADDDIRIFYQEYEKYLLKNGKGRTDIAPTDAPYTKFDLYQNFLLVVFATEMDETGKTDNESANNVLSRWEGPIHYKLKGDGVTKAVIDSFATFTARLSSLTGLSIKSVDKGQNVEIFVLGQQQRKQFADLLVKQSGPGGSRGLTAWTHNKRNPCVGQINYDRENPGTLRSAIIAIKSETEGLIRETCIHEEITQALGLFFDHSRVRPSIFNDDQEFVHLTEHDEYLLRILYDPRLKPGMTLREASPIASDIVDELWAAK